MIYRLSSYLSVYGSKWEQEPRLAENCPPTSESSTRRVIQVIEKIRLTGARTKDEIILRVFRAIAHLPTMEQPQGQQRLTMPDRMVVGNLHAKAAVKCALFVSGESGVAGNLARVLFGANFTFNFLVRSERMGRPASNMPGLSPHKRTLRCVVQLSKEIDVHLLLLEGVYAPIIWLLRFRNQMVIKKLRAVRILRP